MQITVEELAELRREFEEPCQDSLRDAWEQNQRYKERNEELEAEYKRISKLLETANECNRAKLRKIDELKNGKRELLAANADLQEYARKLEAGFELSEGVHASEIQCLNAHLEAAHEARRKAENAVLSMRDDYELGRLVRAMPPMSYLSRNNASNAHMRPDQAWYSSSADSETEFGNTPEEALRAAGVGKAPQPVTERQETATNGIRAIGRKEYCPATIDHFCPKVEACTEDCLYDTAVKS